MSLIRYATLPMAALCAALLAGPADAQLFEDGLDDQSADVLIVQQPDTVAQFVDYSNLTVGAENFSLPEAPRMVAGSAATSGLFLQANLADGAAAGVNVLAGATPQVFTGGYKLSFDAYINVGIPVPSGGTEQLVWGIGNANDGDFELRNTRGTADGIWGWLAGENGYGSEDAAIFVDGTEAADLGDTQPGERWPFNASFSSGVGGPNGAAANNWVEVDVINNVNAGVTRVLYNGVPWFNIPLNAPDGAAMFGYEDPFTSISAAQDFQWGVFDNFRVTEFVPEPTSLGLLSLGGLALLSAGRRRREAN